MADIQETEIIQKIINALKLSTAAEKIPRQIEDKVRAVVIANPNSEHEIKVGFEVTANDNDKTITVPDGEQWRLVDVFASMASTATVGNRIMQIIINTSSVGGAARTIFDWQCPTQAASLTNSYMWTKAGVKDNSFVNQRVILPLPDIILDEGFTIRIRDAANVDAADDMTLHWVYERIKKDGA